MHSKGHRPGGVPCARPGLMVVPLILQDCLIFCVREEPVLFLRAGDDFVSYTPRDKQNLQENVQGLRPGGCVESLELSIRKEVRPTLLQQPCHLVSPSFCAPTFFALHEPVSGYQASGGTSCTHCLPPLAPLLFSSLDASVSQLALLG